MENKKVKGQKIKPEMEISLKQQIITLQNTVMALQQQVSDLQSENLLLKKQGGIVEIRGLYEHGEPPKK